MKTLRNILANTLLFATALGLYQACVTPVPAATITLTLSWTDNATNEAGFKVYFRNGTTGDFSVVETIVMPDTETFVFQTGVNGGEALQFMVSAYNVWLGEEQESGPSNTATFNVPINPGLPSSPSEATVVLSSIP